MLIFRKRFFCDIKGSYSHSLDALLPDRKIVEQALLRARDSATRPDGAPYSAWKAIPSVAIALVLALISLIFKSDEELEQSLLLAFMVFLPKKSFGLTPSGLRLYCAANLRPLSLSNTLIKIVCSSLKICLCTLVDSNIHVAQKCISGRNLVDNVILLDTFMHFLAISDPLLAACLLFDFSSAFPSLSHEYLWECLSTLGFDKHFISGLMKLYKNNLHFIKIAGKTFSGPNILAGVRQGCPLSMILFAIAIDVVIRKLQHIINRKDDQALGAFADDIGIVIRNVQDTLPEISSIFSDFARISGLHLNIEKCVVIPLVDSDVKIQEFTAYFHESVPEWSNFAIKTHGEYLGFQLGPGSTNAQFDNALKKGTDTIQRWKNLSAGFFYNILASNVFILSLFTYVGQLAACDKKIDTFLNYLERKLFVGPGNWLPPGFLCSLNDIGFPSQVRNIKDNIAASKVRVACLSSLDLDTLSTEVGLAISAHRIKFPFGHPHYDWHCNAFAVNLTLAKREMQCELTNAGEHPEKWFRKASLKQKSLQRKVLNLISQAAHCKRYGKLVNQIRKRLERFCLGIPLGHATARAISRLKSLRGRVKPSAHGVFIKTLLNGWPTSRRMRHTKDDIRHETRSCPFCGSGDDSLEHFALCRWCKDVFSHFHVSCNSILDFLCLDSASSDVAYLTSKVKVLSLLFTIRSAIVHNPASAPPLDPCILLRTAINFVDPCY